MPVVEQLATTMTCHTVRSCYSSCRCSDASRPP